jgi:phosphoribosylanthranilate isomerase
MKNLSVSTMTTTMTICKEYEKTVGIQCMYLDSNVIMRHCYDSDMLLKVCGMRDQANIHAILEGKPALLGFIFYDRSPRFVGDTLQADVMRNLGEQVQTVGVFVNAELHIIMEAVERYHLRGVQLHGTETPAFCSRLRSVLPKGVILLKAFSIATKEDFMRVADYEQCIDFALFDTKGAQHGGNGTRFDWALLQEYHAHIPFFLSGGIGLEHVEEIKQIRHAQLVGVDVNSRFETAPAVKDAEKLVLFAQELRGL